MKKKNIFKKGEDWVRFIVMVRLGCGKILRRVEMNVQHLAGANLRPQIHARNGQDLGMSALTRATLWLYYTNALKAQKATP